MRWLKLSFAAGLVAAAVALLSCHRESSPRVVELLPDGGHRADRLPLIIALHGRGSDAQHFAPFVQRLSPPARVVALRAPQPFAGGGFTWFNTTIGSDPAGLGSSIEERARELTPLIAEHARVRPTCGDPVVVGYSQGGALALALASHGAPIAAAVELAGALPSDFRFAEAIHRLHGFHGTADKVIPYAMARATFSQGPQDGGWTLMSYAGAGHDPTPAMLVDVRAAIAEEVERTCPSGRDAGTTQ